MRILIAYQDDYRVYRETIQSAIQRFRPHVKVDVVHLDSLEAEVRRLDPPLVICSQLNTVDLGGRPAWVKLSHSPDEPSEICVGGRRTTLKNPSLKKDLLAIIDETEELLQKGRDLRGC
jgi:hypothetical protein